MSGHVGTWQVDKELKTETYQGMIHCCHEGSIYVNVVTLIKIGSKF